jgi:serine phosphatase RsbU (regulator of sigma subunit)
MFGTERVAEMLGSNADRPAVELARMLVDAVQQFHGDQLADDLAILVLGCGKDASGVSSACTAGRCSTPA